MTIGVTKPRHMLCIACALLTSSICFGQTSGYVNNSTWNSADWSGHVSSYASSSEQIVAFEAHPIGNRVPDFFSSLGVTLAGTNGWLIKDLAPLADRLTSRSRQVRVQWGKHPTSEVI